MIMDLIFRDYTDYSGERFDNFCEVVFSFLLCG